MNRVLVILLAVLTLTTPVGAWNSFGHLTVAAIAYDYLSPKAQTAIDALLRHNDLYETWVEGVPAQEKRKVAFMRAATWPDLIKNPSMGYQNDGNLPNGPDAIRNIGYADKLMHRYWHFIDIPFSPDNTPVPSPDVPNIQTQIATFRATLKDPAASPDVKSYDLVWLLHLVGDAHQPLHTITRFDQQQPQGDRGGNEVTLCSQPTVCNDKLHAFWDDVLGTNESVESAMVKAKSLPLPSASASLTAILDESVWIQESHQAAKDTVYAAPVGIGAGPYTLDSAYKTAARELAERRVALAGVRLANVLNDIFN